MPPHPCAPDHFFRRYDRVIWLRPKAADPKFCRHTADDPDSRNDSQVIFYDQVIPGSVLLGYLNADHWAVAVPVNRSHPFISSGFLNKNAFPREVLLEAIVRYIEEDLNNIQQGRSGEK